MKLYLLIYLIIFSLLSVPIEIYGLPQRPDYPEGGSFNRPLDPQYLLRRAKIVCIKSRSVYFNEGTLENALTKNSKFSTLGFILTKDSNEADIIIEVQRVLFTSVFTFAAIDRRTGTIVATGKATSILGLRLLYSASQSMARQFLDQAAKAKT